MVIRIILAVLLSLGSCSIFDEDSAPLFSASLREAAWLYDDVFTHPESRTAFIQSSKDRKLDTAYLSVYRPTENALGRRLYAEDDIADVIRLAHEAGIEVWAAYGNDDWPELGAAPGSFPYERFAEIHAFNRANPDAPFDGIILDVEPHEPVDLDSLITFYSDALEVFDGFDLRGAVAVRYFWKQPVVEPATDSVRAAYEAIIDLSFDHVVVMGYRNYAGDPCDDNGLICLNEDHVLYAHRSDRRRHILVGLRTTSVATDKGHAIETFHGLPGTYLEAEKRRVTDFFRRYVGFGGFATHRLDIHQGDGRDSSLVELNPAPPTSSIDQHAAIAPGG